MSKNGPTLVPEESFGEAATAELRPPDPSRGDWILGHPVALHRAVEAHQATSTLGPGVFVSPRPQYAQAGAAWIRRCTWWLQVHAPLGTPGVLDSGLDEDGLPWVVVDAPPGASWRTWRDSAGPLPVADVVAATAQAAELLEQIHTRGWAHQDLHLDTLSRTPGGTVHVVGWGSVGLASSTPGPATPTPSTKAPTVGRAGDIAALATAALEALSPDVRVLLRAGQVAEAVQLALPDPSIELRVLRHIFSKAVHPAVHERWDTMESLSRELTAWQASFGRGRWG